jgi:signal transduction histidine kinase
VRASNNDEVWNETGASVGITITPPYWSTWWFRTLAVLAVAGILTLLYRYRIRKLLELERLRFRIATDLHDDIGSNLGSIALVTDMVKERFTEQDAEHRQLEQASRAARQMTDAMRDIVWFINPDHDRLDHLITRMKDVAGTMLGGIDYTFHHDDHISPDRMPMEFKRNLFLIYKEALHNIVRHARANQVSIRIEEQGGILTLMVRDNGKGFDPSAASSGSGLKSIRSRANQIHGELMILPEGGTTVLLRVKLP